MKINTDPNYFTFWFTLYWLGYLTDTGKINTVSDSSEALDNGYDKMTEVWQEYNNSEYSSKEIGYLEALELFFQEKRNGSATIKQVAVQISANQFMAFFNDTESLNTLSTDDRIDVFKTVMVGSSDFTKELLDSILDDYNVERLEIVDKYAPNRLCPHCHTHFNVDDPESDYQVNDMLDETFCSDECSQKHMFSEAGQMLFLARHKNPDGIPNINLSEILELITTEVNQEEVSSLHIADLAAELYLKLRKVD